MRIYLVGFMGSGKTTVGRKLAAILGYDFIDLDDFIENEYKISIPRIFEKYDENAFRKIEHKSLKRCSDYENTLISTGGGTPCFFNNMELINNSGFSVYIRMHPKSLYNRLISSKKKRPLLKEKSPEEIMAFIEHSLKVREPFYNQAALTVKGEDIKPETIIEEIRKKQEFKDIP
jgi:shikimate kinase